MDLDIYEYGPMEGPWAARLLPPIESDHEQKRQIQDRLITETLKVSLLAMLVGST